MRWSLMKHAPYHCEMMHLASNKRQVFTDANSRHGSADGIELSSNVGRRVRFGVPSIQVTHPAPGKQDDAGPGFPHDFGCGIRGLSCSLGFQQQNLRKGKSQGAKLKEVSSI